MEKLKVNLKYKKSMITVVLDIICGNVEIGSKIDMFGMLLL